MDLVAIQKLIDLLTDTAIAKQVDEIEVQEGELRVHTKRGGSAPVYVSAPPAAVAAAVPAAAPQAAAAAAAPAASEEEGLVTIKSPIVGTYYDAPAPGASEFVHIGDRVESGQVVCIIEAMKLMNEIEAEQSGQIVRKLVTNGQPVEYGEPLLLLRPDHK
jgi:acetyl-CoA carboxylase biotin carboxyl carrier protein